MTASFNVCMSTYQEYYFTLQPKNLRIILWTGASYAVYSNNRRSHTGVLATLGGHKGLVYFRSSIQKIVSDSSTYTKLIAQYDGIHTLQWMTYVMTELDTLQLEILLLSCIKIINQQFISLVEDPDS